MQGLEVDVAALAHAIALRARAGETLVVGLTGPVAVGKSTLAAALVEALPEAAAVGSDGFLWPNAELEARGLSARKGFPESYDGDAMRAFVSAARVGRAAAPGYDHAAYDVAPGAGPVVDRPAVLVLEGLGVADAGLDLLVYLDAAEGDVRTWFGERLMRAWAAGRADGGFYARFPDEAAARALADWAWGEINLPNWREHIAPLRAGADIVLHKDAKHRLFVERGL
jgi:type I pantothenate kinase